MAYDAVLFFSEDMTDHKYSSYHIVKIVIPCSLFIILYVYDIKILTPMAFLHIFFLEVHFSEKLPLCNFVCITSVRMIFYKGHSSYAHDFCVINFQGISKSHIEK